VLNEGVRHIIAVPYPQLVCVVRAHTVTAIIEDASRQQRWRVFEPQLTSDRIAGKLPLRRFEDKAFHNGLMLTAVVLAPVCHLANVNAVLEQIGERPNSKASPADHCAFGPLAPLGPDAAAIEVLHQRSHRSQFKVAFEDRPYDLGLGRQYNELL